MIRKQHEHLTFQAKHGSKNASTLVPVFVPPPGTEPDALPEPVKFTGAKRAPSQVVVKVLCKPKPVRAVPVFKRAAPARARKPVPAYSSQLGSAIPAHAAFKPAYSSQLGSAAPVYSASQPAGPANSTQRSEFNWAPHANPAPVQQQSPKAPPAYAACVSPLESSPMPQIASSDTAIELSGPHLELVMPPNLLLIWNKHTDESLRPLGELMKLVIPPTRANVGGDRYRLLLGILEPLLRSLSRITWWYKIEAKREAMDYLYQLQCSVVPEDPPEFLTHMQGVLSVFRKMDDVLRLAIAESRFQAATTQARPMSV